MSIGERFAELMEWLKKNKKVKTDKEFALSIDENANGVGDLKNERKKLTVYHLQSIRKHYPYININWIVSGEGDMIYEDYKKKYEDIKSKMEIANKDIALLKASLEIAIKQIDEYKNK
jgi:hypothetical protein